MWFDCNYNSTSYMQHQFLGILEGKYNYIVNNVNVKLDYFIFHCLLKSVHL